MAIIRPLFATFLLLCSLLVIASANDYSYDSSKNESYDYGRKPQGEEKPDYGKKPTPKGEEKHEYGTKPDFYKPQPEDKEKPEPVESKKPDYGTKPDFYKPQPEENKKPESSEEVEKPNYNTKPEGEEKPDHYDKELPNFYPPNPEEEKEKPESESESEEEEKPDYGTKPDSYKPQPEENKKSESSEEVEKPNYNTKPEGEEKPDHYDTELPDVYPPKPELLPVGVQGLVLCKSGPKYYPIQGASARITCLAVDENGYEKPHSVYTGETDARGYFFVTLSPLDLEDNQFTKLMECKAFLESSPLETCNIPVDVNKGISGASLSDFLVLSQKRMKLYSMGPFFFTSKPNAVPNGY
ncbi:hypothetical protein CRYUN_Cryun14cG0083200 [Craigia yunnanensis]